VPGHRLARTTRTTELRQISEINHELSSPHARHCVTAELLGIAGIRVLAAHTSEPRAAGWSSRGEPSASLRLSSTAVLARLSAHGPPDSPYIAGHFEPSTGGGSPAGVRLVVFLHTGALERLSDRLGLKHRWGV
jgi:hypothetical protein